MAVEFSGSGSEYFRIWIVNLLLTLVSLGLYYPWAKVRRLRYFYGNTVVDGHTLEFHGEPKRMLRGYLLVGALVLLYSLAGNVSPAAGLIAFVIVAAVWPALFRASQQFRMANTSWRGLRFRFSGDLTGAYRAVLPLFIPGVSMLVAAFAIDAPLEAGPGDAAPLAGAALVGGVALVTVGMLPLLLWLLKKYQHDHYALGQTETELRTGAGSFYAVALKALGVMLLAGLAAGIAVALIGGSSVLALAFGGTGARSAGTAAFALAIVFAVFAAYASVVLVVQPYVTSRLQNLVWSRTGSRHLRFKSNLRFGPLLWLTLKNWLLVLLTLGLYWPFAKVATARLRLQAVSVHTLLPPDAWVSTLRQRADDASGEAAGDLIGIDIGM